jgi:hypothetical protein
MNYDNVKPLKAEEKNGLGLHRNSQSGFESEVEVNANPS